LSSVVIAQDFQAPQTLPSTKDEFIKSEKDFIAAVKWLETTPLGKETLTRKKTSAWVIAWISNSPTVTETIYSGIIKPFDKNPDLLGVFMGGYARYVIENNYDHDLFKGNLAGIKAVINCANLSGDIKKDKNLTKLLDADKGGKLEEWVKEAMAASK
jgi:hypothetical protein